MRVKISIEGDLSAMMADEIKSGERAVTQAMRAFSSAVKADWRGQVGRSLGPRLANAVRSAVYPSAGVSLEAAGLVYTKAAKIVSAHEDGALIRATNGTWLAIPTEAAGKGAGGRRITPQEWQRKTGQPLRFIGRPGRSSLLVADARLTKSGRAGRANRTIKSGKLGSGSATVLMFVLVRQTRLPKRLSLLESGERIAGAIPSDIVANWPE